MPAPILDLLIRPHSHDDLHPFDTSLLLQKSSASQNSALHYAVEYACETALSEKMSFINSDNQAVELAANEVRRAANIVERLSMLEPLAVLAINHQGMTPYDMARRCERKYGRSSFVLIENKWKYKSVQKIRQQLEEVKKIANSRCRLEHYIKLRWMNADTLP